MSERAGTRVDVGFDMTKKADAMVWTCGPLWVGRQSRACGRGWALQRSLARALLLQSASADKMWGTEACISTVSGWGPGTGMVQKWVQMQAPDRTRTKVWAQVQVQVKLQVSCGGCDQQHEISRYTDGRGKQEIGRGTAIKHVECTTVWRRVMSGKDWDGSL